MLYKLNDFKLINPTLNLGIRNITTWFTIISLLIYTTWHHICIRCCCMYTSDSTIA